MPQLGIGRAVNTPPELRAPVARALELPPPTCVLVRYGELALKGGNRGQFESALCRNMRSALRQVSTVRIDKLQGRYVVTPASRTREAAIRLQDVPGIKSVSPVWSVPSDPEAIVALARTIVADAMTRRPNEREVSFRVSTKRADKSFPIVSTDFDRFVADRIIPVEPRLRVQLVRPELDLGIDVRREDTYVFVDRLPGPGGLPVGTLGRALCLISGGIDSPVAAWMAMKRGLAVSYVTYHSYPFIGDSAKHKVIDLVRALARYQPTSRLYVVPFAEIQTAIRDIAPEGYRTILYRRMMQRIATRIAQIYDLSALITGDSLGQVASQTLENIACISSAAGLTVLRPLIGFDKDDTIELARKIGTFDISNRSEPDCCSLFMPSRPMLRGKTEVCEAVEERLDVEARIVKAIGEVEIHDVESEV